MGNNKKENTSINVKRDSCVDLIRIIATIMVILFHVILPPIRGDGSIDIGRLVITCALGDGVTIFWIVAGFFIFRDKKYKDKLLSVLKTIIIPSLIIIIISCLFSQFITNDKSVFACLKDITVIKENFKNALSGIITFNAGILPLAPHLWYVFTYVTNYLWVPLLTLLFYKKDNYTLNARKSIIILGAVALLLETIEQFWVSKYGAVVKLPIVSLSLFLIILGKIIYDNLDKIKNNKKIRFIGLFIFIFFECLKIVLQYFAYKNNVANAYFVYWSTLPAVGDSIGLILFILSFSFENKFINHFGKISFGIYLVHWMVKEKLIGMGFSDYLSKLFRVESSKFFCELLYVVGFGIVIYLISLIIVEAIHWIKQLIMGVVRHEKNN